MENKNFITRTWFVALAASLCCLLWGSAYPCIKIGYGLFNIEANDLSGKFLFAGFRFLLAGLLVLLISLLTKKSLTSFSPKTWGQVFIFGVTQTTLQYIFFYLGLAYSSGVRSSILNGTGAFFSILLAHFIYKNEKLGFSKALGCIIGFLGIILINLDSSNSGSLFSAFSLKGDGSVILAAFILSAASIYGKKITQHQDTFIVTGFQLTIGGFVLIILGFALGGSIGPFTPASLGLLLYMAFLSAVAFSLWAILLKYNSVGKVAIYNCLTPIFGAFLSAIFLGENILEFKNIAALILVCLGIFIVNRTFTSSKASLQQTHN